MKFKKWKLLIIILAIIAVTVILGLQNATFAAEPVVVDYMRANAEIDDEGYRTGLNFYTKAKEKEIAGPDHMTVLNKRGLFKKAEEYYISKTNPNRPNKNDGLRIEPSGSHWLQMTEAGAFFQKTFGSDGQETDDTSLTLANQTFLTLRYKDIRSICVL